MRRRYIFLFLCALLIALTAVTFLPAIYTSKDTAGSNTAPKEFFINGENRIEYREDGQCSAYAAAYVMRSLGENTNGEALSSEIKTLFGFVTPKSVERLFKKHGYRAKAYHGDISTLESRVSEGVPVIVFIRTPHGTDYAVVTGYDKEYIYLADPTEENTSGGSFNRRLGISEFEELWKTGSFISDNAYIVVEGSKSV